MKGVNNFGTRRYLLILIVAVLLTDFAVLLNIPFLRQIIGFLLLTLLPGLLILQILKLNRIESTEKFVLSVGLSVSFVMFFGLLLNNSSLGFDYETPLATSPLLISFNIAFVILVIIGYKINKEPIFSLPKFNLSTPEKAFIIVPILFPALSIFGTNLMNTTDNNILLMLTLFLIPIYVIFVCFFNQKFPKRLYPVVIFLISISLVLMFALRSNHIIGADRHVEYYFFQTTLNDLYWDITGRSILDACLSISLLPAIYQSILNTSEEYLYKILVPMMISILPLIIYLLSKRYIDELYAFLASFFLMSQYIFAFPGGRTQVALLFFALAMLVFFSEGIDVLSKKLLFVIFMLSCLVSHYSTTYIFFVIMLGSFLALKIFSTRYYFKMFITATLVFLFFTTIFLWYGQVTGTAFTFGIFFIKDTLISLQNFFIIESRSGPMQRIIGMGIMQDVISFQIEFILTWIAFAFIAIGIISMVKRYKEMIILPAIKSLKPEFLKRRFEIEYFVIALACSGLLGVTVAVPYLSVGYDLNRIYNMAAVILSFFFVMGGMILSKYLKVRAYVVILVILIPCFLCALGPMHSIFGYPRSIVLNSEGKLYDMYCTHDQESCGARWLGNYVNYATEGIYRRGIYAADYYGGLRLTSQGAIPQSAIDTWTFGKHEKINGPIYLSFTNIVNGELKNNGEICNMTDYQDVLTEKNKIYDSGCSRIYR